MVLLHVLQYKQSYVSLTVGLLMLVSHVGYQIWIPKTLAQHVCPNRSETTEARDTVL